MTRFSAPANAAASSGMVVPYVLFAEFDFASGKVRLSSADRALSFGGVTYEAVGKLGSVGPVRESGDLSPEKLEFTLTGVDTALMATTLTEKYHGRSATLYVGYLATDSRELVATPHPLWEGRMDTMTIQSAENSSSISLICESRLVLWDRAAGWLLTDEHQKLFDPTDDFLDQVATLPNKVIKWGEKGIIAGPGVGGPGGGGGGGGGRGRR